MDHAIHITAGGKEVCLSGRVTFADFSVLKTINESLAKSDKLVVFNLSEVEFLDSAALGMILLARDTALGKGIPFSLKGAKGQVKRLMQLARVDSYLEAA